MRIGGRYREIGREIQVDANIAHPQIVVSKSQSLLERLIHLDGDSFRLVLAGKAQEILDNPVRSLRLLVKFFGVYDASGPQLTDGSQQLAISQDGGKRVVQFMSNAGDELANRGEPLAVEQLFLRFAKVLVGLARFFVKNGTIDGARNLAADSN